MAEYQLTETDVVLRTADGAYIPNDPDNRDRVAYDMWLVAGNLPDPYVPPEPPPPQPPQPETVILFDHENRLRAIEGAPAIDLQKFLAEKKL